MTNTNTKKFMAKVQNTIINDFEWNREKLINQLKVFTNIPSQYQRARELVLGGCFDCYYSQVATTMAEWFGTTTDRIWEYYKEDSEKLWDSYVHIMSKNIIKIVENKIYIEEQ